MMLECRRLNMGYAYGAGMEKKGNARRIFVGKASGKCPLGRLRDAGRITLNLIRREIYYENCRWMEKIIGKPPRNSAGFCGGGQGLSWAVEPRKEEEGGWN
jgi:hypothetical protein